MPLRETFEDRENESLAPYAQRSRETLGREHPEEGSRLRANFQKDVDRIVHSNAFRRLEYKTQVFINHEGDYYRTRLTHTMEVSQIARGLARLLRLNEDLSQAIALAHDLGHTPFGHAGEAAMRVLMEDAGGFEHNLQSYRVVTELEHRYPDFQGLNLCYEVREGILKHQTEYDHPAFHRIFHKAGQPTLEAQLVNFADEIAYMNHDLDDGLESQMLQLGPLEEVALWDETYTEICKKHPEAPEKIRRYRTISWLIHKMVEDLKNETCKNIREQKIETLKDVRNHGKNIVALSPDFAKKTKELKNFLFQNLYYHWRVERMAEKAKRTITDLFNAYLSNPRTLPQEYFELTRSTGQTKRHICDYIAGMTDRFALLEHKKLFDPQTRV